jgi:hypothetical protein
MRTTFERGGLKISPPVISAAPFPFAMQIPYLTGYTDMALEDIDEFPTIITVYSQGIGNGCFGSNVLFI